MKTTVTLPDPLLDAAKRLARRDGITFKELLEVSLQRELDRRSAAADRPFELRKFTVGGRGVQDEVREGDWFDLVYPAEGTDP